MSTAAMDHLEPVVRGPSLRADLVTRLIVAVLEGKLKAGDRLIVRKLAARMGVSATPVREALVELAGIGIVELLPSRSAVVLPFGRQELLDIYHVRRLLEVEATRRACGQVPPDELASIATATRALEDAPTTPAWINRAMELDHKLHQLIACNCGSNRLVYEIGRYRTLMHAIGQVVDNQHDGLRLALHDHLKIIEALQDGDRDRAGQMMDEHIRAAAQRDLEVMFERDQPAA